MLKRKQQSRERGQALIEFILIMPILLTFIWYLVHVNSAINKSVVAQTNARGWLFVKLFNHSHGPVLEEMAASDRSTFSLGVAGNVMEEGEQSYVAEAPMERLGIGPLPQENTEANNEPGEPTAGSKRQDIRVRTAFGICTARKTRQDGQLTDMCGS